MKEMQQDTRLTLISRIPVMILGFISMTILTRWLGPEGNGIYTFLFANINLLLLLFGLQSEPAIIHYLSKPGSDQSRVMSMAWFTLAMSFLVFAAVILITGYALPGISHFILPPSQPLPFFLWFIVWCFLFRKMQNVTLAILRGTLQFKLHTRLQLWSQLIPILLYAIGFLVLMKTRTAGDAVPVFRIILLAHASVAVVGFGMVLSKIPFQFSMPLRSGLTHFLSYSVKSMLDALGKFINRRVDVYFVEAFKGTTALGQYGLASQINNFTQEAILPITQVMNPYLVKSDQAGRAEIICRMSRIVFTATCILALLIVLCAPWAIPLVFGKSFSNAIVATQLLSLSVIFISMRPVFANYFQSINQLRYNIQSNWLGVLLTILLDFLLIPTWGIEGAAVASVIAYISSAAYLAMHFMLKTQTGMIPLIRLTKSDVDWLLHLKEKP